MSEMVDRLGEAIEAARDEDLPRQEEMAKAALTAARQPTDAMMAAAALSFSIEKWLAEAIWKCMADEALK